MFSEFTRFSRAGVIFCMLILHVSTVLLAQRSVPAPASLTKVTNITDPSHNAEHKARLEMLAGRIMRHIATAPHNVSGQRANSVIVTGSGGISLQVLPSNSTCGYSNGSLTASASGGNPPYYYTLTSAQVSIPATLNGIFSQLPAGNYQVSVIDQAGLSVSQDITLTNTFDPPSLTIVSSIPVSSCTGSDGSVTVKAGGGSSPYQYSIDGTNFQNSNIIQGLTAGDYLLYVRDGNGCIATVPFIANINPLNCKLGVSLTFTNSQEVCNNEGYLQITDVYGGTPPYSYSLDGVTFQTDGTFDNLPAGIHKIYIKDQTGLVLVYTIVFYEYCPLYINATETDASCGTNDGTITLTGSSGSPPYSFMIQPGNPTFQASGSFTGLAPGNYTATISDFNNTTNTTTVTVGGGCPSVTAAVNNATCGLNNGSAIATGTGGYPPYQFSLDNMVNFQSGNIFNNLAPGNHTIWIQDSRSVQRSVTVTISAIPAPVLQIAVNNETCVGSDGSIDLTGSSGTGTLQYSIDNLNFQSSPQFPRLDSGNYIACVKDGSGCLTTQPVQVPLTDPLTVSILSGQVPICEGTGVPLSGLLNVGTFSWSPSTGLSDPSSLNPIASPHSTTQYHLTAAQGICKATDSITITVWPAPYADGGQDTSICIGTSAKLLGSGGVSYSWQPATWLNDPNSPDPVVIHPLRTISYYLSVVDIHGCQSLQPAKVIVAVEEGYIFAGNDTSVAIGQPLQLYAADPDSNGFDAFRWSPAFGLNNPYGQNPLATFDQTGVYPYTVNATAPNGCQGQGQVTIKVFRAPDIFVPSAFTPNGDGHNDVLRAIPAGMKDLKYLAVYNRWGQQVFYTSNQAVGWDGTMGGRPQPGGTYIWMAEGTDYEGRLIQRKGSVILIR